MVVGGAPRAFPLGRFFDILLAERHHVLLSPASRIPLEAPYSTSADVIEQWTCEGAGGQGSGIREERWMTALVRSSRSAGFVLSPRDGGLVQSVQGAWGGEQSGMNRRGREVCFAEAPRQGVVALLIVLREARLDSHPDLGPGTQCASWA